MKVPVSIGQQPGEQVKCETEASGSVTRGGYAMSSTAWGNLNIHSFPYKRQEKKKSKEADGSELSVSCEMTDKS